MRRSCGSSGAGPRDGRRRRLASPARASQVPPCGRPALARRCSPSAWRPTALGADAARRRPTLRLTVDEAVKMALEHNVDLNADRLDPQISDTRVAAAAGAFRPTFNTSVNRNNQLQPPSSFLIPTPTQHRRRHVERRPQPAAAVVRHDLQRRRGTPSHTNSNSFLNSYNPLLQSGLSLSVSQPLCATCSIDSARQQLATSRTNRDIADTRLRESLVHTTANVKSAYWNLVVGARQRRRAAVGARARAGAGAREQGQGGRRTVAAARPRVGAGRSRRQPGAADHRGDGGQAGRGSAAPADLRPDATATSGTCASSRSTRRRSARPTLDLDAAVTTRARATAPTSRARARTSRTRRRNVKFAGNQRLPDVRAERQLSGERPRRHAGAAHRRLPRHDRRARRRSPTSASVLDQLFAHDYPTWARRRQRVVPDRPERRGGQLRARAGSSARRPSERLKSAEARAIQQVRDAGWKIEMNAKRIETTRAARELAEQRLDAEQKRFEVGMSTSFLVIQAQRDLAQAKANELARCSPTTSRSSTSRRCRRPGRPASRRSSAPPPQRRGRRRAAPLTPAAGAARPAAAHGTSGILVIVGGATRPICVLGVKSTPEVLGVRALQEY